MGTHRTGTRTPARIPAIGLCACVALAACSTTAKLEDKTQSWTPPAFDSAEAFSALIADAPTLCTEGSTVVDFAQEAQSFAFVIPLNKGSTVRLETLGDPALDAVLALYGPGDLDGFFGTTAVAWDDDVGDGRLARIDAYTATRAGQYLVLLSTWEGQGRGPVELAVTVDDKPGCVALRKGLPDLDVLFVVDDSPSMVQEQRTLGRNIRSFLERLDPDALSDIRFAVTTTNVCAAAKPGAVRGRFVYRPATSLPPDAMEKRAVPCTSDADCQQRTDLPDAANWVCEAVNNTELWTCDWPSDVKEAASGDDTYPGDYLFTLRSRCRYKCEVDGDPLACTRRFGVGPLCGATCGEAGCSTANCGSLGSPAARCQRACGTDTCQSFCQAYLGQAPLCTQACLQAGAAGCQVDCAGGTTDLGVSVAGIFPGQHFLCAVACQGASSCDGRCVAEFRDEDEQPYRCLDLGQGADRAGCLFEPIGRRCPEGVPTVVTREVAADYAGRVRRGEWAGEPSWDEIGDTELQHRVLARLLECQVSVGGTQEQACALQEQGLRAAWLALDPQGENADQATQFVREDATLLLVVISDEDDCSAPEYEKYEGVFDNVIPAEMYPYCACLRDEDGCLRGGACDASQCMTGDAFEPQKCPVLQTSRIATSLKGLKPNPDQVLFAAFAGAVVPGSAISPSNDAAAIRQRYYDCKCNTKVPQVLSAPTYACQSDLGMADQGDRYAAVATAFGAKGWFGNLCGGVDLDGLADFVRTATGAEPVP